MTISLYLTILLLPWISPWLVAFGIVQVARTAWREGNGMALFAVAYACANLVAIVRRGRASPLAVLLLVAASGCASDIGSIADEQRAEDSEVLVDADDTSPANEDAGDISTSSEVLADTSSEVLVDADAGAGDAHRCADGGLPLGAFCLHAADCCSGSCVSIGPDVPDRKCAP